jgi:TonB-dependent SusC/RagA subfamily outer membrane receptor
LKDAATASVYGSKAGNGVVLVTTKSGADAMGKPKFEYQGSYTFNRPTRKLFSDEMSAYKELVYQNLVAEANGLPLIMKKRWNMQKHMIIMSMI